MRQREFKRIAATINNCFAMTGLARFGANSSKSLEKELEEAKEKIRILDNGWQTMINLTKLGRTGVSFCELLSASSNVEPHFVPNLMQMR